MTAFPKRVPIPNPALPGTMLIPLTRGRFAIVDEVDATVVSQWNWAAQISPDTQNVYAQRTDVSVKARPRTVTMHRFLWQHWGLRDCLIDHVDDNGLNNTRSNLRRATPAQNCWNTRPHRDSKSGVKGVRLHVSGRWEARIFVSGKGRSLGLFGNKAEAAAAYASAARKAFGEFARVA